MRLQKGTLVARLAEGQADVARAQELRHLCFLASRGICLPGARDVDAFDARCCHVLVEELGGRLLGCFRVMFLDASRIGESYSAQFYDLSPLRRLPFTVMELGRFCINPRVQDTDVLRLCWAFITRLVDEKAVGLMFGCTSFPGADPDLHAESLAHLSRAHVAPVGLGPLQRSARAIRFPDRTPDPRRALAAMPPLLRSYLGMGGWVGDHAVADPDLDTLHVFTAVEVARIPATRARALRALAT